MTNPRYSIKPRFKMVIQCPTKILYMGKKQYPNTMLYDSFLEDLADGDDQ